MKKKRTLVFNDDNLITFKHIYHTPMSFGRFGEILFRGYNPTSKTNVCLQSEDMNKAHVMTLIRLIHTPCHLIVHNSISLHTYRFEYCDDHSMYHIHLLYVIICTLLYHFLSCFIPWHLNSSFGKLYTIK